MGRRRNKISTYKFKTTIEDYKIEVTATPQYDEISKIYAQICAGIDQELIRNMPEDAVIKLLSQLLEHYIGSPAFDDYAKDTAYMMLLKLKSVLV